MFLPLLLACGSSEPIPATPPKADLAKAPDTAKEPDASQATKGERGLLLATPGGVVTIEPIQHGTLVIHTPKTRIWVDPTGTPKSEKAQLVLLTDIHGDHLDPAAIEAVSDDSTILIAPAAVEAKLERPVAHVLANGESISVGDIAVEAVPMYNLVRGPEAGSLFHDKGRGNGYIVTVGKRRIYLAGDTECTPEMKALKDIDLAFIPMNLPYTMPPEEAAACVRAFQPVVAVPYHYKGSDPGVFAEALQGSGVTVELLDFYKAD